MDELAVALDLDPVELRVRNEPAADPETGTLFSSRWLVGTGVAASTDPAVSRPSGAIARVDGARDQVSVNATDTGTGARTAMWQIAVDALQVPAGQVELRLGDSRLRDAPVAGGSAGTASWGWAVHEACRQPREQADLDGVLPKGLEVRVDTGEEISGRQPFVRQAFGAQFVEVRVAIDSGEVRVPRLPLEEGRMDARFGDYVNADFASYHVATCAVRVRDLPVHVEDLLPHLP